MPNSIHERWVRWKARRTRVGLVSFWFFIVFLLALFFMHVRGLGALSTLAVIFTSIALVPLLLILFTRWLLECVLWKVRNRLILTYLLMGVAPVVLVAALFCMLGYVLAGQYATNTALSKVDQALTEVQDETANVARLNLVPGPAIDHAEAAHLMEAFGGSRISFYALRGGVWQPLLPALHRLGKDAMPIADQPLPSWLSPGFRGVIALDNRLFLCFVASGSRVGSSPMLGSMPLDTATLGRMAQNLGTIRIIPGYSLMADADESRFHINVEGAQDGDGEVKAPRDSDVEIKRSEDRAFEVHPSNDDDRSHDQEFSLVKGGELAPRTHFFDAPVVFSAGISIVSWTGGHPVSGIVVVSSRPTLLYTNLFATSNRIGATIRIALTATAVFFALIEMLAMLMAAALSRTITRSVAELYRGTRELDAGNLAHRVRVARHDQLGTLASSFNSMAASITDLLQQQREKQRLLNELAIAQEVQTTLFPKSPVSFPGFEMHAVCLPARTVGGDYFDFLFTDGDEFYIALGDISGKGMSAALLMASLHAAVHAFSLGERSEESSLPSPAILLKLINRHLYDSTQMARYATLFLARYNRSTHRLTYSNGGHLPPLVLSAEGALRRLDKGGPVVGLLDGLEYEEASVELQPGDMLLAFTDGVTEPEQAGQEFGEDRLLDLVCRHRREPLTQLVVETLKSVQDWIGSQEQPDDMTLLVARQF